ncbi:MAG: hypothetical protein FK732_10215 [Asgard group archaeon]|nr:hypothetical protein [Asgard group archaeon]
MTAQMPDQFLYKGESYALIGLKGSSLFNPEDYGVYPVMASTACYRGFVATYNITDKHITLSSFVLRSQKRKLNKINGRAAKKEKRILSFNFLYENLDLPIKFTGFILLGKDFINEMYVHMGFQRPISYETVIEFQFKDGEIVTVNDFSELIAKLRKEDPSKDAKPEYDETTMEWIERLFSLDYNMPW